MSFFIFCTGSSSTRSQKMLLQLILVCFSLNAVSSQLIATTAANCATYLRKPDYTDINVDCGTNYISLAIQLCPAVYSGFNESQLFINSIMNDPTCKGTLDNTVAPPVLRFTFAINMTNGCGSTFTTTSALGTGIFSDFSNIQTVNISGVVKSFDPSVSTVTYNTDLKYFYSCSYPLEYLINNTQLDVSSSAIAVRDRNGSFISTLSLKLYSDATYATPLVIPAQGIELRSTVFALVQATNLTSQYMVLLDRCYASVSRFPTNFTYFNLFVGCNKDQMTTIIENGQSQNARFSFPAFRFMEQQNQTISRYYLHCITRLCESAACSTFRQSCSVGRRRREVDPTPSTLEGGLSEFTYLTSPLIITKADTGWSSTNAWNMLLQLFIVSITVAAVSSQLTATNCNGYLRLPEYTDIAVECGTNSIGLAIQICPAVYTGYNESLLLLNNIMDDPTCRGTVDTSVAPPVLRFNFPINQTNACGSIFKTTSAPGTGIFSDFSNIQTVNISGVVRSYDPTIGTVTYNAELKYLYSCAYPLEYLIKNTQLDVSSTSVAVQDSNGSFISTLSLRLFSDVNYTKPLVIPRFGIELRTNIFVQVHATNLTTQYFVLLDRCFASTSLNPDNATYYNLFVPCFSDEMTNLIENGQSNQARFSFPAFRFTEQQNRTVSTYYLHCITRLCEKAICGTYR
ncbi:hypothetical protein NFI96_034294, partial [Prochilodus magdalenae]